MREVPSSDQPLDVVLATYMPDLPMTDWEMIQPFVAEVVAEAAPHLPYPAAAVMNAVAHHVDWCVLVAGVPMDREELFSRDIIGAAVAVMPTTQSSSRGRRRSLLFRVGEALGAIPVSAPLPPLAAATPTAPYTALEIEEISRWAWTQQGSYQRSARALIALGLGAGLHRRDIVSIRPVDVAKGGEFITVRGDAPRTVPVSDAWMDELAGLAGTADDSEQTLFLPGSNWSKNMVTVFVFRSLGSALRPSTQRMRSTWLVDHLATGTPMQDLLAAAGLSSMNALVRYERYLPRPSRAAHADTPR